MKKEFAESRDRRSFLRGSATMAGMVLISPRGFLAGIIETTQDPPNGCPAPPTGGTPFVAGQDTRTIILRKSIKSFSPVELGQFQSALSALRSLPSNDPRTWVLQADLHALYCRQCSNDGTQIHFSWNFFPWHRAYLYYYERILGSLVGNLDGFRLPYWDWENIRTLPAPYVAVPQGTNPLWDDKRNAGLKTGGSLPINDGSQSRINLLAGITDFASVGGTEFSSGDCELNPHGTIHNDVGQPAPVYIDMGDLGFAARDPIFFAHHCNIDKFWSNWNRSASRPGLSPGAYKNPTDSGFLNARWSFYDENKNVVSISAADVLDHENNLRYIYEFPRPQIPFEIILECFLIYRGPGPDPGPFLKVSESVRTSVLAAERVQRSVVLVLLDVAFPSNTFGNFDVLAVRGDRKTYLGSLGFVHETEMKMKERMGTVILDATNAVGDLVAADNPASIHVVARMGKTSFVLRAKSAQLRLQGARQ